jgi:amicoumacin kinase
MAIRALLRQTGAVARMLFQTAAQSRDRKRWERGLPPIAVAPWGGDPSTIRFIIAAKHVVLAFDDVEGRECVLKLAPEYHGAVEAIEREARFANFLAAGGVSACLALPNAAGSFAVPMFIPRLGVYVGAAYERARGHAPETSEIEQWDPLMTEEWGAMAGRLHRVALRYEPSPQFPLTDVISPKVVEVARAALSRGDRKLVETIEAMIERLNHLPRAPEWFGAIHGDLSPVNFFIDDRSLRLFDFESSGRGWFAHDLASAFYTVVLFARDSFLPEFVFRFVRGYLREHTLLRASLESVPAFLRYHALLHYAACRSQRGGIGGDTMRRITAVAIDGQLPPIDYGAAHDRATAEITRSGVPRP